MNSAKLALMGGFGVMIILGIIHAILCYRIIHKKSILRKRCTKSTSAEVYETLTKTERLGILVGEIIVGECAKVKFFIDGQEYKLECLSVPLFRRFKVGDKINIVYDDDKQTCFLEKHKAELIELLFYAYIFIVLFFTVLEVLVGMGIILNFPS